MNIVSVRGEIFPSQKQAAAALGVTPGCISMHLYRHGHCDRVGLGPGSVGNQNAIACAVQIGPHKFRSQKSASEALGVSRNTIRRFVNGTAKREGIEKVVAAAMRYGRFGPVQKGGEA